MATTATNNKNATTAINKWINVKRLFSLLGNYLNYYVLAALLLIASVFFRSLEPKVLQLGIDQVVGNLQNPNTPATAPTDPIAAWLYSFLPQVITSNATKVLLLLGLMFLVIALIRGVCMLSSSAITAHSTQHAMQQLRNKLFKHLQHLPLSFYGKNSTGELIQRSTGDITTVQSFINQQVIDVVMLSFNFVFSFVMMAVVHLPFALFSMVLIPFIMLLSFLFFQREGKVWEEHEKEADKLTTIIEENLSGTRVVKAFAQEEAEIDKFTHQNHAKWLMGMQHIKLHALYWPFSDMLVWLQFSGAIMLGGYYTLNGIITIGELASLYTYILMATFPMRRLGKVVSQMGMAIVAMDRISNILETPIEDYSGSSKLSADKLPETLKGNIVFKNVWFSYHTDVTAQTPQTDSRWVLKDLSFNIPAGATAAIMGKTGAGKSTIVALLNRFYEVQKGNIYIDGIPIEHYPKTYIRKQIGVVLQRPFLFSTTIGQNIAYVNPHAQEREVVSAATDANIHEIMDVFPHGYRTLVGEKGVTLSGGQKQRVTLARTLLENPAILILDDTTSAVDGTTEQKIQQALKKYQQKRTSIIIAHRISAVQHADIIIVLNNGQKVQEGKHQQLITIPGFYRHIYTVQQAN